MATLRKTKTGWQAEVARAGVRASKVFPSKREAQDWANRKEYEILNGSKISAKMKLRDLFERYAREVRAQIRDLGGIPAFARGGAHQGGARIVGERGWIR